MIIIGHRGAAGLALENTMASFEAAVQSGADMLEFDIRLTRDGVAVVIHDARLKRTHGVSGVISQMTLAELKQATKQNPVPTLTQVLDAYFGKVILNIELKSRSSAKVVHQIIKSYAKNSQSKWDNLLISSFLTGELTALRKLEPLANLALLHNNNPFTFLAYHRSLNLSAVGFHRLHTNRLATEIAKKLDIFCYIYTVNLPSSAKRFARQGFDGIVTNYPDRIGAELQRD